MPDQSVQANPTYHAESGSATETDEYEDEDEEQANPRTGRLGLDELLRKAVGFFFCIVEERDFQMWKRDAVAAVVAFVLLCLVIKHYYFYDYYI